MCFLIVCQQCIVFKFFRIFCALILLLGRFKCLAILDTIFSTEMSQSVEVCYLWESLGGNLGKSKL